MDRRSICYKAGGPNPERSVMSRLIAAVIAAAFCFALPALAQAPAPQKKESMGQKAKEEATESSAQKKAERDARKAKRKAKRDARKAKSEATKPETK